MFHPLSCVSLPPARPQLSHRTTLLQRNGALPARETCELLVLDRSVDPVAPVIHEWTYEALVYDLLSLDDNIVRCDCRAGGSCGCTQGSSCSFCRRGPRCRA